MFDHLFELLIGGQHSPFMPLALNFCDDFRRSVLQRFQRLSANLS